MKKKLNSNDIKIIEPSIRGAIFLTLVEGIRQRNPGAVVNATVVIVCTYLPCFIERRYEVTFQAWQRVYTESAMLTHAIGMLGPYDDVWWWDHLTHTHSSTLLSGFVHVGARRNSRDPRPYVLVVTICLGCLWEMIEYAIHAVAEHFDFDPVLVSYGKQDTLFDLLFNLLGAYFVLLFGDRLLRNLR